MFKFKAKQKIFDVGGIMFGGQPGELPTVLIGSIFYFGHKKIELDEAKGTFNQEKAEQLINEQESLSDLTGNPSMIEVVGATPEAMENEIDFVAEVTEVPFMISSELPSALIAGAQYVYELGLQDKVIYNSLLKGTSKEELEVVKDSEIKAAVLLAKNPLEETATGKVEVTKDVLKLAERAEVDKPIIDVASQAFGVRMGAAARAIYLLKDEYGYPVGMGTGNVITTSDWARSKLSREILRTTYGSVNAICQILGANWLLYGPIQYAKYIFPSVAIADSYVLTAAAEIGAKPYIQGMHPLFKLLRG